MIVAKIVRQARGPSSLRLESASLVKSSIAAQIPVSSPAVIGMVAAEAKNAPMLNAMRLSSRSIELNLVALN